MFKIRPIELFFGQFILYFLVWLWNDYNGMLISLLFGCICLFILLISLIVEWIEPSKISRSYFTYMFVSVLAPLLAGLTYFFLFGELDWLK